jgi:hypothetical protein
MPSEDYIAVLRSGRLFREDLVDIEGTMIPVEKLDTTFQAIVDKVVDHDRSWVGILSADDRNSWAEVSRSEEIHLPFNVFSARKPLTFPEIRQAARDTSGEQRLS